MPKLSFDVPPPSLMRELREVATDAARLAGALGQANRLPAEFPREELVELLDGLGALPSGTAEGCRQPLEYARSRLPAIRRRFIATEEQSDAAQEQDREPPALTRGMSIDQRLGALVNSVTTALDEYRSLASAVRDDVTDTAPSQEIDAESPDVAAAISQSKDTESKLASASADLDRMAVPGSETADRLRRQMSDARGLARLARIELKMPDFVPRWYRKTIDGLSDYPGLLRKTAGAVRVGVDIARPMVDGWSHFLHGFKHLVLDSIDETARKFEALADKWEAERRSTESPAKSAEAAVPPPDFDLDAVRRMILDGQSPPPAWRPWITELDFNLTELDDLAPIAGLTALTSLSLYNTKVDDLAPIAGLTALTNLWLDNTQVHDFSLLAGLTELIDLSLNSTRIDDLAPIADLAALRALRLNNTKVDDLTPIRGLTALTYLWVNGTQVDDLAPISSLTALTALWLDNTKVDDLAPIAGLTALTTLWLGNTKVDDLAPIAGLTALTSLSLDYTQVDNLTPIAGLTALTSLSLDNTQVDDLAPVAGLTALATLWLNNTQVNDLTPIAGLTALEAIYVESDERKRALAGSLGARAALLRVSEQ